MMDVPAKVQRIVCCKRLSSSDFVGPVLTLSTTMRGRRKIMVAITLNAKFVTRTQAATTPATIYDTDLSPITSKRIATYNISPGGKGVMDRPLKKSTPTYWRHCQRSQFPFQSCLQFCQREKTNVSVVLRIHAKK
jgi:hypothetical protein